MLSSHSKIRPNKDESICNTSKISSTSNINSLKKLFENNFKLTNPFKSKNKNTGSVVNAEIMIQNTDVFTFGKSTQKHENVSNDSAKENRCVADISQVSKSDSTKGSYLDCNIPNCCCKTFFREYNNTPFRYRHIPKTPLKERSSQFNRIVTPKSGFSEISGQKNLNGSLENRNKFLNINYEFYKPKSIDSTFTKTETALRSNPVQISKSKNENTFSNNNLSFGKRQPDDVINKNDTFEEDSLNIDEKFDNEREKLFEEWNQRDNNFETDPNDADDRKLGGNFNLKYRVPKFKNIALRENSHPYAVKKPRLTVKSVKNRNMRNVKRRQKMLDRSQTFNGYDNFAYRRSITELNLPKSGVPVVNNKPDPPAPAPVIPPAPVPVVAVVKNHPVVKGGSDKEPSKVFRADNRITSYNWPVTSFYTSYSATNEGESKAKYSSTINLSCKSDTKSSNNFILKKSNLKRHCSLGYLQDELYEYNFTRRRRSLDFSMNKVSATCGIRNIPEVNNKIVKQRKFQNLDIHAHALFAAVEHGYVEKTKSILESSEVDVNSVNSDGLSPLDVAVLSNNKPLVKVLVTYGAQEGRKFYSADDMRNHLYHLLHEAERRVQELGSSLRLNIESDGSSLSSSSSNIPSITVGDSGSGGGSGGGSQNKTYSIWERRAKGLKRMLMGFEQIRPPDPPATVNVEVTSVSSLMVYFQESENKNSSITTKFRVQWSTDKDFCSLCGHYEVADTRQMRYHVSNLRKGQSYFVRVAGGNIKGYSAYKLSTPLFIVPSSWQDVTEKDIRFSSTMKETLDDIFGNVVVQHPYLKSNVELYGQSGELLVNQQQRRKKTTIKQLFTAASKFQKHLRRGVYLSCLLYHEDKVLVTNEDFLPVIEVDETYPKKIHNDFHWFFKVVFSWSDLKWLKTDMEKSQNSSAVFRIKLLQAAVHMQTALSIQELGKLYHKLVRDAEGTIVISVINYIHSPKSVSVLNLRWLPLAKLTKRTNIVNVAESNVADILMSSIPDQITYHQVSSIKLPRGLYLSYLKMRSSVDSLQVLVPSRAPNIPPHCKIRDNPHVTAEEWEWLVKKENLRESLTNATHQQRLFIEQIAVTARRLFTYMEVSEEEAANHRLYDAEVIEVSKDVSLIMVVPPAEAACSMPGQRELLLQRSDLLPLTVQVFEMVHFGTYQLDLISTYSRLSCIIEMDMDLAQHSLRKAFSSSEVSSAKSKLTELENLHTQLNTSWKRGRWLLDAISFARDRLSLSPTNMRHLLNVHPKRTLPSNESHCYLQPPDPKTAKSRGSWPGVGVGRHLGRMPNEISRSEQHLTCDTIQNTQPSIKLPNKPPSPIEASATDSQSGMETVAPFNSEDTLTKLTDDQSASTYNQNTPLTTENSSSGSLHSVSLDELLTPTKAIEIEEEKEDDGVRVPVPSSAVLQVHAAYNTGLDNPHVNFKFQVNARTTAREIVELFIKQTNMSALLKGREAVVYTEEDTSNFCLVSVIGARERCLRDDFKPVQLQSPWNSGRLYVRRKSNVLAAIECDSKQSSSYV